MKKYAPLHRMVLELPKVMPLKRIHHLGQIEPGQLFSYDGYAWTFHSWKQTADTKISVNLGSPDDSCVAPFIANRSSVLGLDWPDATGVIISEANISQFTLNPRRPLDWHTLDSDFHYPTCCGRLWPCEHAHTVINDNEELQAVNDKQRRCSHCSDWLRNERYIQFGTTPMPKQDDELVKPPAATLVEVKDGFVPFEPKHQTRRFCGKSKCVTAARQFGKDIGWPIPGTRKQLVAELRKTHNDPLVFAWPQTPTPQQLDVETSQGLRLIKNQT